MFYDNCDGVIFVWDVSVNSTLNSLDKWLDDISESNRERDLSSNEALLRAVPGTDEESASTVFRIPLLVVGNKLIDLIGMNAVSFRI